MSWQQALLALLSSTTRKVIDPSNVTDWTIGVPRISQFEQGRNKKIERAKVSNGVQWQNLVENLAEPAR